MKNRKLFILLTAALLFILLFIGGPDYSSPRSLTQLWNLGHIPLFLCISYLLTRQPSPLASRPFGQQGLAIIMLSLLIGGLTEGIQGGIGRSMDLLDIARNCIGALLGLCFLAPGRLSLTRAIRHSLQAISLLLLVGACLPLALALWDEQRALNDWPVLASFKDSVELNRWSATGEASLAIGPRLSRNGKQMMRVQLGGSEFTGANFVHFPKNWSAFQQLHIELYNPGKTVLAITCRIHDKTHSQSIQKQDDRFNHRYQIEPGWNQISIAIKDIAKAPTGRSMDTRQIDSLQLFASKLDHPATLYVAQIYLNGSLPAVPDSAKQL